MCMKIKFAVFELDKVKKWSCKRGYNLENLKIFEDLGGKGKSQKVMLPITEETETEEPVLIQIEDVEAAED